MYKTQHSGKRHALKIFFFFEILFQRLKAQLSQKKNNSKEVKDFEKVVQFELDHRQFTLLEKH